MTPRTTIGRARVSQGLSVNALGRFLGMSGECVRTIESGRRMLTTTDADKLRTIFPEIDLSDFRVKGVR